MSANLTFAVKRRVFHARLISLFLIAAASCSEYRSPTSPVAGSPPPPPPAASVGSFYGNIMDGDTHRMCIKDARAEIIAGPSSGNVYPQNLEVCEDPGGGFAIHNLPLGAVIRLRASAPGYTSVERDFIITRGGSSIDINLKRV